MEPLADICTNKNMIQHFSCYGNDENIHIKDKSEKTRQSLKSEWVECRIPMRIQSQIPSSMQANTVCNNTKTRMPQATTGRPVLCLPQAPRICPKPPILHNALWGCLPSASVCSCMHAEFHFESSPAYQINTKPILYINE